MNMNYNQSRVNAQIPPPGTAPVIHPRPTLLYQQPPFSNNGPSPWQQQPQFPIPAQHQTQQPSPQHQVPVAELEKMLVPIRQSQEELKKAQKEQQEQLSKSASKQEILDEVQQLLQQTEQKVLYQVQQQVNLWAQIAQMTQIKAQQTTIESLRESLNSAQLEIKKLKESEMDRHY
ncbi:hypothetical protein N8T08_008135 [Aspergillus melleus]|uniref:Uncharacterized protein n=1 Tax=Aspergillus melleus TaxID=138277 RepID=A0ACC3AX07_9EURO|nr:hypothetical protein N8T08_008135 [Aspergillus melleus]